MLLFLKPALTSFLPTSTKSRASLDTGTTDHADGGCISYAGLGTLLYTTSGALIPISKTRQRSSRRTARLMAYDNHCFVSLFPIYAHLLLFSRYGKPFGFVSLFSPLSSHSSIASFFPPHTSSLNLSSVPLLQISVSLQIRCRVLPRIHIGIFKRRSSVSITGWWSSRSSS